MPLGQKDLTGPLARLADLLLDLDHDEAMLPGELDGLLCGVAIGPEPVSPNEWLPLVWGGDAPEEVDFPSGIDPAELTELAVWRYNAILGELAAGTYAPIYDIDERSGDILWEIWIEGLEAAMSLRFSGWERLIRKGRNHAAQDAAMQLVGLMALSDPDLPPSEGDPEVSDKEVAELIPLLAMTLYQAHVAAPAAAPVRSAQVGRNDPCPCGSGKKYKRCCGAN